MKYRKKLALFTLFAMNLVEQPAPEVRLAQGSLVGRLSRDGSFFEYMGIPYATSGASGRFKAPGPPPRWEGTLRAMDDVVVCPQPSLITGRIVGSEDCLRLNVYAPAKAPRPLAVMVFVHGGAFILGSGGKFIYGPDFFMRKEVILVTFNYRLGALGFTCLGIEEAPGNAGLRDQVAALEWVKSNIAAFGGDPDDVTLFGESAGATSIALLTLSTAAEGLFSRAILQSGSAVSNWAIDRRPLLTASLVASKLGYRSDDPRDLYKFLRDVDFRELVAVGPGRPDELFFDTQLLHLPCVEEEIPGLVPVVADLPWNILSKKASRVPVIHGTNSREGMFLTASVDGSVEQRNGKYIVASDLHFASVEEGLAVSQRAQRHYFGTDRITVDRIHNITDLYTHLYFEIPTMLESELRLNGSRSPVYNYIFDYSGGRNFLKFRSARGAEAGACHGDELFYMFHSVLLPFGISRRDWTIVDRMTTMWTNFAKYGEPTPRAAGLPFRWAPSDERALRFLYIDDEFRMGSMPDAGAYALWKGIYLKYRKTDVKQASIGEAPS